MSEIAKISAKTTKWKNLGKLNSHEEMKDNTQNSTVVWDATLSLSETTKLKTTFLQSRWIKLISTVHSPCGMSIIHRLGRDSSDVHSSNNLGDSTKDFPNNSSSQA